MTLRSGSGSGSGQACAACKFQRRRCTPQCLLAPFFPADQPHVFQNVHRLFGVKHIQKLLKELHPHQRLAAMSSVKFHAAMREKHPALGCVGEMQILEYQIHLAKQELHAVLPQLLFHRQKHQKQLGMAPPGKTMALEDQPEYDLVTVYGSPCSNNIINGDHYNKDCNDADSLWIPHTYHYSSNDVSNNNADDSILMQSEITATSQTLPMPTPEESIQVHDYNEMYSLFDNTDDRQSYISPKEMYGSSLGSSIRDCRISEEYITEKELKNARARFTLTSIT